MIVLDASVVIALLDATDAHHDRAVQALASTPGPYLLHPLTIGEVLVGPARVRREEEVWRDLQHIGAQIAELGDSEPVLLARLRAAHRLTMPDTCVLATAQHAGVPLLTFDHRVADIAARVGLLHREDESSASDERE